MRSVIDLAEQVKDYAAAGKTIAPVENGTTAVGSYAIGEKFIREGVLYKAKTSITAGDTLTLNTNYELADNVVTQISDVKQALNNEAKARAELGAHNLLPIDLKVIKELNVVSSTWSDNKCTISTANGSVEFTVNSNKSIGVKTTGTLDFTGFLFLTSGINYGSSRLSSYDGISNSTHKISGGSDAASATVQVCYDHLTEKTYIRVATGATGIDVTVYPMITLITDSDSTFRPYVPTNSQLLSYKDNGVLGAKNFALPIKSYATTSQGITTSTDADGITTITGTATGSGGRVNIKSDNFVLKKGTYKIVGISNDTTKYLDLLLHDSSNNVLAGWGNTQTPSQPDTVTLATDTVCFVGVNTYNGTAYGTGAFKFGFNIQLASDSDLTYQPYAMTNRELTDVAKQVEGGYILIASGQTVEVTADGTKTHATLLNELYTAIGTVFSNNPSYYIRALSCRFGTVDYPISLPMEFFNSIYIEYVAKGYYFGGGNGLRTISISSNSIHQIYDLGNATLTNISSDVPASGLKYIFKYDVYKKIS